MSLSRSTLISAIRMGLRKSAGKDVEAQLAAILDTIDLAIELQTGFEQETPAPALPPPSTLPPPPNPEAVIPTEPHRPSLVTLADDRQAASAIQEHRTKETLRVKSQFLGRGRSRVSLEDLAKWAMSAFPLTLQVIPRGYQEPVEIERNIYTIPMGGERPGFEKRSSIKVVYKHPKGDVTAEVGHSIRVEETTEGFPAVDPILENIREQAREMYKKREAFIEGVAPRGPALDNQYRNAARVAKEIYEKRKPSVKVILADSEVPVV